jgi:hypothetical protein
MNFEVLKKEGFSDDQINYLKVCSDQKEWEDFEIQKRWISVISEMTQILYEWDHNQLKS